MYIKDNTGLESHERVITESLATLHHSNVGKVSNKWSSYLPFYDNLLSPIRDKQIRLFEIGVQNGGSLETWGRYFKNASAIVGCDVDERCKELRFDDPRIRVIIANANSESGFRQASSFGLFDLIIDDGSHLSEDILVSFLNYFPVLSPGGIYVIEDIHAIYQRHHTNIRNKRTVLGFFKDLTDVINYQFWHSELDVGELLADYLSIKTPPWLESGWIESIEFRNSIIVVKKSLEGGNDKLGQMVITGEIADVDTEPLRVKKILSTAGQAQPE